MTGQNDDKQNGRKTRTDQVAFDRDKTNVGKPARGVGRRSTEEVHREKEKAKSPVRGLKPAGALPPENISIDLKTSEEWGPYYAEEPSPYNDVDQIHRKIYLASKSTKLELSNMGLEEPLPREAAPSRQ